MESKLIDTFTLCKTQDKNGRNGQVPGDWCKAVILPLYKGKGSHSWQDCIKKITAVFKHNL